MTNMVGFSVIIWICVTAWRRTVWVAFIHALNAIPTNVDPSVAVIENGFMTELRLKLVM